MRRRELFRRAIFGLLHLTRSLPHPVGVGLDVGSFLADLFGVSPLSPQDAACSSPVPHAFYLPAFLPTAVAFSLLLNAGPFQLVPMAATSLLAFGSDYLFALSPRLEPLAAFASALLVAAAGNLYGNATGDIVFFLR